MSKTFKEFCDYYYKNNRCLGDAFVRKNPYTCKQLKTRYNKYLKRQSKHIKSSELRQMAMKRDNNTCQLYKLLDGDLKREVDAQLYNEIRHLDMAHVFNKSSYPFLKYDLENVTMIYRLFHNRLDTQCNPINGKPIEKYELEEWWKLIVGIERWENLKRKIKCQKI